MSIIEIKDLVKKYKDNIAVNKLNLNIEEGEIFALLGVNGAGKTTTIRMLSMLTKPTSGDALIFNKSILNSANASFIKEHINLSTQETAISDNLTVRENLDFMASIYGVDNKEKEKRIEKIVDDFSLKEVENKRCKVLSGGYKRKVSIAIALITNPKILFLDEPTLGLDVLARRELWDIIRKIKKDTTIILTTHYMEEAEHLSDRVAIMVSGEIKALGSVSQLKKKAQTGNFEEAFVTIARGEC